MSASRSDRLVLYLDPSHATTSLPPGHNQPGFERAYAEARMLLNTAYAGASKRVLCRLVKTVDPLTIAIARWMVREIRAAHLIPMPCEPGPCQPSDDRAAADPVARSSLARPDRECAAK